MKPHKQILLTVLILAVLGGGITVFAESAAEKTYVLPEFHIYAKRLSDTATAGSKIPAELKHTPASITIVNTDEMERLGVYNLTDSLEYNAGITVAPRGYDN